MFMTQKLVGDRLVVKKTDLEKKMLTYLRKARHCVEAGGVSIAPVPGASARQANWTIVEVDYGNAPKADCDRELTRIAPLFLRHFNIAPDAEAAETAA
jgi:hypothetical protein